MTDSQPTVADSLPEYRSPRLQLRRKADLAHLPEAKARQLRGIAQWICEVVPVDWVILFGSHARGDWVEDPETGYASDYDLLVIPSEPCLLDNTRLWARLERDLRALADPITVTLLVHPLKEVNDHLRQGQYFFTDIVKEGIALLDANRTSLAIPPSFILPEQRLKQASFDLNYWFNSANEFWRGTGYYMARGLRAHAAFLLHQSVERYYHALTLVFTNYKFRTHDIEELAKKGSELHPLLVDALPRGAPDDRERFDLLKRAYIEARYSKEYRISDEQLTVLREQVLDLAGRVLDASREKLDGLFGADAVGTLPTAPGYGDDVEPPAAPALDDPEAVERWSRLLMEEGRELGRSEGREEGLEEGKRRIARTLLARGVSADEVAEIVGLSVGEVSSLACASPDIAKQVAPEASDERLSH